jgi:hypothetical protein
VDGYRADTNKKCVQVLPTIRWGSVEVRRCARTILLGVADEDVVHNDVTANVETQDSLIDWRE